MEIIDINGPNRAWGTHQVEVVLKLWDYSKTYMLDVGGNVLGISVIEHAVGQVVDQIDEAGELVLTSPTGEELLCDDDTSEEAIGRMVVSARIVGYTPPTVNAIRAINGAAPLPEGDRPCDHDAESVARRRAERTSSAA